MEVGLRAKKFTRRNGEIGEREKKENIGHR